MIFDMLCSFVERHNTEMEQLYPGITKLVNSTKLFILPERLEYGHYGKNFFNEIKHHRNDFFLPFPHIAVESKRSCTIFIDTVDEQLGLHEKRKFIFCEPLFVEGDPDDGGTAPYSRDDYTICTGYVDMTGGELDERWEAGWAEGIDERWEVGYDKVAGLADSANLGGAVHGYMVANKKRIFEFEPTTLLDKNLATNILSHVFVAVTDVAFFNTPSRFVVESKPINTKKSKKSPKTNRSHQRPQYTILTPDEIRNKFKFPSTPTGRTVAAHERRRHVRIYRDDRYVNMKGKKVTISATWIGPSEAVIGNKRYKVMLDI